MRRRKMIDMYGEGGWGGKGRKKLSEIYGIDMNGRLLDKIINDGGGKKDKILGGMRKRRRKGGNSDEKWGDKIINEYYKYWKKKGNKK